MGARFSIFSCWQIKLAVRTTGSEVTVDGIFPQKKQVQWSIPGTRKNHFKRRHHVKILFVKEADTKGLVFLG